MPVGKATRGPAQAPDSQTRLSGIPSGPVRVSVRLSGIPATREPPRERQTGDRHPARPGGRSFAISPTQRPHTKVRAPREAIDVIALAAPA